MMWPKHLESEDYVLRNSALSNQEILKERTDVYWEYEILQNWALSLSRQE